MEGGRSAAPPQRRVSYGNSSRENSINQSLPAGKQPWAPLGPLPPIMLITLMASTLKWLQLPAEVGFGRHMECVWVRAPPSRNFHCLPILCLHVGLPGFCHTLTATTDHILGHKRHKQTETSQNKECSLASSVEKNPGNAHLSCAVLKSSSQVEEMQVQICTLRRTVCKRSAKGEKQT